MIEDLANVHKEEMRVLMIKLENLFMDHIEILGIPRTIAMFQTFTDAITMKAEDFKKKFLDQHEDKTS